MAHFEIKNRWTDAVIYSGEAESLKDLVGSAVEKRISLRGANLRGAYLGGANLRGANLGGAYLGGANLGDANLSGANLGDAYLGGANLGGANLGGAYLGDAYLGGAYLGGANLGGAYLGDAYLGGANHVFSFAGIGRSRHTTSYWVEAKKIWCGCFTGTPKEFITQVEKTHADNPKHLAEYRAGIAFLRACLKAIPKDELTASKKAYAEMMAKSAPTTTESK